MSTGQRKNKWKSQYIAKQFKNRKKNEYWEGSGYWDWDWQEYQNIKLRKKQNRKTHRQNLKKIYNTKNAVSFNKFTQSIDIHNEIMDEHIEKINELIDECEHLYCNPYHPYQIASKYYNIKYCTCFMCMPPFHLVQTAEQRRKWKKQYMEYMNPWKNIKSKWLPNECRQKQKIMRLRKNNCLWGWYMDYYGMWHRWTSYNYKNLKNCLQKETAKQYKRCKKIIMDKRSILMEFNQTVNSTKNEFLLNGFIRRYAENDIFPKELIVLCFNYLFCRIKLVLINSRNGGKVNFDKCLHLTLPANYPLIALKYALRNDFKTEVKIFFRYDSVFNGEDIKTISRNKWVLIQNSTKCIMKVGDIGVDEFGKNMCTILVDVDERVYLGDDHEDYWNSLDRTDHEMKMYRSLSYYLDTSGHFWILRLDSDIQKQREKLWKEKGHDSHKRFPYPRVKGMNHVVNGLLSLGIQSTDFCV